MNNFFTIINGVPHVDTRVYCKELGINHTSFFSNVIRKYQSDFEQFGGIDIKTVKRQGRAGRPEVYALLNANQALLANAYTSNTDIRRAFKLKLLSDFVNFYSDHSLIGAESEQTQIVKEATTSLEGGVSLESASVALGNVSTEVQEEIEKTPSLETMDLVRVFEGEPRADSRAICQKLGVGHNDFLRNIIRKYQADFEQLGAVFFENGSVTNSVGAVNTQVYALLNEGQTNLVLTYAKNTQEARACKLDLVKGFALYKKQAQGDMNDLDVLENMVRSLKLVRSEALETRQIAETTQKAQQEVQLKQDRELQEAKNELKRLEDKLGEKPISMHHEKEAHILRSLRRLGTRMGGKRTDHARVYDRFSKTFNVSKYSQLPISLYEKAVKMINLWNEEIDILQNKLDFDDDL